MRNQLQINENSYQRMLNAVSHRTNWKSLCINIVGHQHKITQIDVSFRIYAALKLTCLPVGTVATVRNKKGYYLHEHIRMTDEIFNKLRVRGLCP